MLRMKGFVPYSWLSLSVLLLLTLPAVLQGQFIYTINNGAITITGYTGPGGAVTIPSSTNGYPVTSIGAGAFSGSGLTSVTIPEGVTSIGGYAFAYNELTNVTLPDSITNLDRGAFSYCTSLTNFTIGSNVVSIGAQAFQYCSSLTSITIPSTVTDIEFQAFDSCAGLAAITVDAANPAYSSVDGALFDKTQTTLIQYPEGRAQFSYSIPNTVTVIAEYAFENCTILNSIVIGANVRTIGVQAFASCSSLASINIPDSVTNIEAAALSDCGSLTNVTIGRSVATIGNNAFLYCANLASVYFQGNAPIADFSTFQDDNNTTVYFYYGTSGWGPTLAGIPTVMLNPTSNQLAIRVLGRGTVSPNYGNAWLHVGQTYTMTAKAATGFAFANWTGQVDGTVVFTTNRAALNFVMQSHLVLTPSFVDVAPPAVTILSPTASETSLTNGLVTVQVRVTDNVAVANVEFYLDGQDFGPGLQQTTTLWSRNFALALGTNTVAVVASDLAGNLSITNSLRLIYVNKQTNANAITLAENWLTAWQPTPPGVNDSLNQDTGLLKATLTIPGLQAMSSDTWSNLYMSLSFGSFIFNEYLFQADVLTTNLASFYFADTNDWSGNSACTEQMTILRSGDVLIIVVRMGNATNLQFPQSFVAGGYYAYGYPFYGDTPPFALTLQDGNTMDTYAGLTNTVYLTITRVGTNNNQVPFPFVGGVQVTGAADFTPPTCTITAPFNGQRWSNAVFTVTGTARDNAQVSNVWVQINGIGWQLAGTTNNCTNWTAGVTLNPGTNIVRAYAVDTSGNDSLTNSVELVYILSTTLTVRTNGEGGITPAYNDVTLQIGNIYSMTAKADKGFGFVNWTDGLGNVITNGATLKFIMASNLTLVANFVDITKPTLTITNPIKTGEKWSNAVFTVSGKAGDNVAVSNVLVSLNGGSWASATLFNHGSNWTEQVTLIPGTNTIAACAVDTSGNSSLINTVKLDYILSSPLTVKIVGEGTLTPNYNGQLLAIGTSHTMTAAGTNGFHFYYWSGGVPMSANSTLTFTMLSNLTIIANFKDVKPPGTTITFPTRNQKWSNSVITVTGKSTDNVSVAEVWVQITDGGWAAAGTANGFTNWSAANLPVIFGTNIVQTYAMDATGNVSLTNAIKFIGVVVPPFVAPTSLAGYAATAKPSGGKPNIAITWDDSTWAQTGTGNDTNVKDYCAGSYTYILTGTNTALLTNVVIGMASALGTTNVTTVDLTFTSATTANYAWSSENDSGSGTMTFSHVSNLVPVSLAGHTLHVNDGNGAVIAAVTLDNDGTFTKRNPNGGTYYGTYTFTQYSPTVAILQLNHTDPSEAGALEYIELNFTSATSGNGFGCYYINPVYGSNPDALGMGTFEIK